MGMKVDIDMSGRVNSPLETLNARVIKSESDDNILLNEKDGSSSLPPKCLRRGLQMEVCVPTMDLLRRERHLKAEEDYKKLDKMINVFHYLIHLNEPLKILLLAKYKEKKRHDAGSGYIA